MCEGDTSLCQGCCCRILPGRARRPSSAVHVVKARSISLDLLLSFGPSKVYPWVSSGRHDPYTASRVVEVCSDHRGLRPSDVVLSASTQRQDPKGGELCRATVKPWETVVEAGPTVLTCKSFVRAWYRGERLIEPPSSWFPLKFPSGSLESPSLNWHGTLIDALCCVG